MTNKIKPKILVVDDEADIITIMKDILKEDGTQRLRFYNQTL